MSHYTIHRLRADLLSAVEEIDRSSISCWLLYFSASKPLRLQHPRMGKIHYEGVAFEGSPVMVFDRFVRLTIEDHIESKLRAVEDDLTEIFVSERDVFIEEAKIELVTFRNRLLGRAERIKGRLLRRSGSVPLNNCGDDSVDVSGRLMDRLIWLKREHDRAMTLNDEAIDRLDRAIERLAGSECDDSDRSVKRLSVLILEPEFAPICDELRAKTDLPLFLEASASGYQELDDPMAWPANHVEEMGLVVGLIHHLASIPANEANRLIGAHYHGNTIQGPSWRRFANLVLWPFREDLVDYCVQSGRFKKATLLSPISNHIHLTNSPGTIIQQGSSALVQTVTFSAATLENMREALKDFTEAVAETSEVLPEVRSAIQAEADTLKAQLTKREPNAAIIRECGKTLRSLAEGVLASAATPYVVSSVAKLLNIL